LTAEHDKRKLISLKVNPQNDENGQNDLMSTVTVFLVITFLQIEDWDEPFMN
jgi:hypothetical protein